MANTGWFSAGSSPTTEMYCEATASRSGSTVTVNCTVKSRHKYSDGFMGTGKVVNVFAKSNLGGQGGATHHSSTDSWSGTAEHTTTFSFTFGDTSNTSATIEFWSERSGINGTAYGFSGKTVSVSFSAYSIPDIDNTMFIRFCDDRPYIEIFGRAHLYVPTWDLYNGQDDIQWQLLNGGSWERGGKNYTYGVGYVHGNADVNRIWSTHVYDDTRGRCYGTIDWFPQIKVAYNANGGSSTPSTQNKKIGEQLTLAGAISRSHYAFKGWSTSSTAQVASYTASQVIDYEAWNSINCGMRDHSGWGVRFPADENKGNTVTLYAVWAGNTYTVSYNANGGSSTPSAASTSYPNSVTLASAISRNNSTSTKNGTITISYNVNGGNSTAPSASTGTCVDTTTTKYTFEKWHLNSTSGTAYSAGASYQPTSNVTMYAGWTSSSSTARTTNPSITLTSTKPTKANATVSSYTVAYNANGGSSTPTTQTATKTRKYTFSKWNSKSDGTGTDYNSATAYTFSANATLYAKYTSSDSGGSVTLASAISRANGSTTGYSVSYNANGGSGAPSAQTSGNRTITYTFNKWAAGSASGTTYSAGGSFTPSANTTMYATWNSSTSANSAWTCSSTKPTRSGYTFLGWSTSSTATTATYTAGTAYTITSGLTLYAVWKLNAPSGVTHTMARQRDKIAVSCSYTGVSITNITFYYRANSTGTYSSLNLGTATSGTITGLTPNTNYQIYATVTNASGSASSTAAVATTGAYFAENPTIATSSLAPFSVTATVAATAETNAANTNYKVYYTKKISKALNNMAVMVFDGSLWGRVFYHNCKEGSDLFTSLAQAKSVNTATKFSALGLLDNYKKSDGTFEFLLRYPHKGSTGYNRWTQTSNPCNEFITPTSAGTGTATGYKAISISWNGNYWGGLARQNSDANTLTNCYLSGSVGHSNWFYAIGAATIHGDGMPAYDGSTWGAVELWVRLEDATVTTVDLGTSTSKSITGLAEETEYSMWMSVTNAGGTNYSTATTFTTPADQARIRIKTSDAWKQGKTYFKKDGAWKKVKKIYIKVNGQWVIGQNN